MYDNQKILNIQSALDMVDNDSSLFKMLLQAFLSDALFSSSHLSDLVHAGNNEEAAHYIHRIKGASAQLGGEKLAAAGQALENVLRGKEKGDIPALSASFSSIYNQTIPVIKDELDRL